MPGNKSSLAHLNGFQLVLLFPWFYRSWFFIYTSKIVSKTSMRKVIVWKAYVNLLILIKLRSLNVVHQGLCWILNNIFKKLFPLFNFSQDFLLDFISETGLLKSLLKTLKPRIALYLLVFLGTNLKSYPCHYNCSWLLSAFSSSDSASPVLLKIYHPLLS